MCGIVGYVGSQQAAPILLGDAAGELVCGLGVRDATVVA